MNKTLPPLLLLVACLLRGEVPEAAPLETLWTREAATVFAEGPGGPVRGGVREALPPLPGVRLRFADGEACAGELLSFSPERLELRAPRGQNLSATLPRLRVMEFMPAAGQVLLDGPAGLTEWSHDFPDPQARPLPRRVGNELWPHSAEHNVICARLPGAEGGLELLIRLRLPEGPARWGLHVFNGEAHTRSGPHSLNVWQNGRLVGLRVPRPDEATDFQWTRELPAAADARVELRIRVDPQRQRLHVLFNDALLHDAAHPVVAAFPTAQPFWLHLQPNDAGIVVIEDLRLLQVSSAIGPAPIPPEEGDPLLILRNGDQIRARIESLTPELARIVLNGETTLSLPTATLQRILFPPTPAPPAPETGVVRLHSGPARSRLHLREVSWNETRLQGQSPNWDRPLVIPLADVDELSW